MDHQDQINQPIRPGQAIAFCHSYSNGLRLGTVVKLTAKRVKIAYKYQWVDRNNELHIGEWTYLARPERTVVITDTTIQEFTVLKLKGLLPSQIA